MVSIIVWHVIAVLLINAFDPSRFLVKRGVTFNRIFHQPPISGKIVYCLFGCWFVKLLHQATVANYIESP